MTKESFESQALMREFIKAQHVRKERAEMKRKDDEANYDTSSK